MRNDSSATCKRAHLHDVESSCIERCRHRRLCCVRRSESSAFAGRSEPRRVWREGRLGAVGGRGCGSAERRRPVRAVPAVEADTLFARHAELCRCGHMCSLHVYQRLCCGPDTDFASLSFRTNRMTGLVQSQEQFQCWYAWILARPSAQLASPPSQYAAQMLGTKPAHTA